MTAGGNVDVDSFVASLHRLEETVAARNMPWLSEQLRHMSSPATDAQINAANEAIAPFRLPAWLEALYRWHNGSSEYQGLDLTPGYRFLQLDQAVAEYKRLCEVWNGLGWYRRWSWPLLSEDKAKVLATLDYGDGPPEPILCWFYFTDPVFLRWHTPQEWITEVIEDYSMLEERFAPDGEDIDWYRQYEAAGKEYQPNRNKSQLGFGLNTRVWPESLLHRAGIAGLLINESELPPKDERELQAGKISDPGPWYFYFGDLQREWYESPPVQLPATINVTRGLKAKLPEGVLPEHALVNGIDVDAVLWFDPETLEDEIPTIQRIAYPR